jgi:hypothetical protein
MPTAGAAAKRLISFRIQRRPSAGSTPPDWPVIELSGENNQ